MPCIRKVKSKGNIFGVPQGFSGRRNLRYHGIIVRKYTFMLNNDENLALEAKCSLIQGIFKRTFLNPVSKNSTGENVVFFKNL